MSMTNFLTYSLLVGYFIIVIAIGVSAAYKESSEGFLIAERNRGGLLLGTSLASAWFGGDTFSFYSSMTYSFGWAPLVLTQIGIGLGFWLLACFVEQIKPLADKYKMYMLPDYFYYKYSRRCGAALLVCNFSLFFGWFMLQFVVGGHIIAAFTGISYSLAITGMAALTLPYLVLGGYKAILMTDIVQFLFLSVLGLFLVGKALHQNITHLPPLTTINSMGGSGTFSLVVLTALGMLVSGDIWQHIYSARSVKAAKSSIFWAFIISTFLTTLIMLIFLMALPLAQAKSVSEQNFLLFALQNIFSPGLMPFVVLMLAVGIISSLDTAAFGTSLSLTNDLAMKYGWIPPERLAFATRITLCAVMVLAIAGALIATNVVGIIYGTMRLASSTAPAMIASFSRKLIFSEPAIFWSLVLGIASYILNLVQGWSGPGSDLLPLIIATVGLFAVQFLRPLNEN